MRVIKKEKRGKMFKKKFTKADGKNQWNWKGKMKREKENKISRKTM